MKLRRLMPHQTTAMEFMAKSMQQNNGGVGLWMAPGTGKTLTAIRFIRRNRMFPAFVMCRRDDLYTWQQELEMENQPEDDIFTINKAADINDDPPPLRWVLTTYDIAKNPWVSSWLYHIQFMTMVVDEAHLIKGPKTKRTKTALKLGRHIPFRIAMTGTPFGNDFIQNVFSQVGFIDNGRAFGTNFWQYMNRYCIKDMYRWYPKPKAKTTIRRKLSALAIVVKEDDVMKLPPVHDVMKSAPMSKQQSKLQTEVLDEWQYTIDSGEPVEFNHTVVQLSKLQQIACGFLYHYEDDDDGDRSTHYVDCPKFTMLLNLVSELDSNKIVIWTAFQAETDRIYKALKDQGAIKYTGHNQERRFFRDVGDARFFICQVDRGVGMNELVVADTAIYTSPPIRLISREQSRRRTRRKGSERHDSITYYDLITEGSVDERRMKALRSNIDLAQSITDSLRANNNTRLTEFFPNRNIVTR